MKKRILFSLLFLSFFLFSSFTFWGNKKVITVIFTHEMTKRDLMDLQKNLKEKNIILKFNRLRFHHKKLTYIDFTIDFGDGYVGSSKSIIRKNKEVGFVRDYSDDAEQPFIIGEIK